MSFPKTPALVTDCAVFDMNGRVVCCRQPTTPILRDIRQWLAAKRSSTPL
jgi:hypothetical protein